MNSGIRQQLSSSAKAPCGRAQVQREAAENPSNSALFAKKSNKKNQIKVNECIVVWTLETSKCSTLFSTLSAI